MPKLNIIHALFTTLDDIIHASRHYSLYNTNNTHTTQNRLNAVCES